MLRRLGSVAFKLFATIDLYSVKSDHVAANWSAGHAAEFNNIGRNVVVVSKSGLVETGPTVLVATALSNWALLVCYATCVNGPSRNSDRPEVQ